jgi:hypothetical protein
MVPHSKHLYCHDNLTDLLIGFHVSMRVGNFVECKCSADNWLEMTGGNTIQHEPFALLQSD